MGIRLKNIKYINIRQGVIGENFQNTYQNKNYISLSIYFVSPNKWKLAFHRVLLFPGHRHTLIAWEDNFSLNVISLSQKKVNLELKEIG